MSQHRITKAIRIRTDRTDEREHSSPLFLTSSFCFDDSEEMRAAFADETDANIYSRFSNPTVQEFVDRMCALEGAEDGFEFLFQRDGVERFHDVVADTRLFRGDHVLALALGRPLGIEDADCDVELPVAVDDENLADYFSGVNLPQKYPSLMTGALALITLYQIAGRVLRQVYAIDTCKDNLEPEKRADLQRSVEDLDSELNRWCDDLPATFRNEAVTDQHVSMGAVLCSHYYSVLTTLHRNFLPVKRDLPVLPKSTARAVSSARSCIRLAPSISNVVPPSHHLAFFIQHLFSSAVIVLLYAMHASDPRAAGAAIPEPASAR